MKRVSFCEWLLKFTYRRTTVLDNVFFTNEAWVHKLGYINMQNYCIWSDQNLENMLNSGFIPKRLAFGVMFHGNGSIE